jgi:flagellar basal-body rod modification protein FlgD
MSSITDDLTVSTTVGQAVENSYSSSSSSVSNDLDKDAFLKLLCAQLQYQDPLDPMDNTEFVAQMAQFTSLEQMYNLNQTANATSAYSIIGKEVYAVSYNDSTYQTTETTGTVDSVIIKNNVPYVVIDGNEIEFSDVQQVYNTVAEETKTEETETDTSIQTNQVVSQAISLVGKYVQAVIYDDDLNPTGYVEGKVENVKFADGVPILNVNGTDVYTYEVQSVGNDMMLMGKEVSTMADDEKVTGTVTGVNITDDGLEIEIGDYKTEIDSLDKLMSALSYVGQNVSTDEVSGTADGVVIIDGETYVSVGENNVAVSELLKR